ncbi:MAG TPA: Rieske 2Fe-2S domain-containing protein [Chloroflexota bacterium]
MGTLLRKFWQPVAASTDVEPGKATMVNTMHQWFTLYRGETGEPHLVAQRCAHRGTELRVGWVEGDCIRCFYHGWKYDPTGQCVEQPAEEKSFAHKIRIEAHPAHEYAGLIWAYLGEGEPPPFPRRYELEREGVSWVMVQVWPCNWFQQVENSIDASHVSFVHREGLFGQVVTEAPPKLECEETEFGIIQRAIRPGNNVRVSDWQFPNCNHVVVPRANDAHSGGWVDLFNWKVPIDDDHTRTFIIRSVAATGESKHKLEEWATTRGNYDPSEHHDELFRKYMPDDQANLIAAQDYIAQVAQGPIVDRSAERLGNTDAGIILLRKLFTRELEAIKAGQPTKHWRQRYEPADLPVPPGISKEPVPLPV